MKNEVVIMNYSILLLFGIVFIAGCTSTMTETNTEANNDASNTPDETDSTNDQVTTTPDETEVVVEETWKTTSFKDVNSGENFAISDFEGDVVVVEAFAVWCSLCLQQQKEIQIAEESFGEDVISVALDIDTRETESIVKAHTERHGFDWRYAIASADVLNSLKDEFGSAILNPTSTPIVIVDREGTPHLLRMGIKGNQELVEEINKYV